VPPTVTGFDSEWNNYRAPASGRYRLRFSGYTLWVGSGGHTTRFANGQDKVGKAIDVRLPGVALTKVRDAGLALGLGGVGYYRRSNFVHLDTGRVRRW